MPKPLVPLLGDPLLWWQLRSLQCTADDTIVLVYPAAFDEVWHLADRVRAAQPPLIAAAPAAGSGPLPQCICMPLDTPTVGAADTLARALRRLPPALLHRPLLVLDCDTLYSIDITRIVSVLPSEPHLATGVLAVVPDGAPDAQPPPFSYVRVMREGGDGNEVTCSNAPLDGMLGRVVAVAEKARIGAWANTGAYGFSSGQVAASATAAVLASAAADGAAVANQVAEVYMSAVYVELLKHDVGMVVAVRVPADAVHCVGTPAQLITFATTHAAALTCGGDALSPLPRPRPLRICVDVDGTLVSPPAVPGDYSTVRVYERVAASLRALKAAGHTVVLATARGMLSCGGNLGTLTPRVVPTLMATLAAADVPFDELHVGKPYADVYVDDKAVNVHSDSLAHATGWYTASVPPRTFHTLSPKGKAVTSDAPARSQCTIVKRVVPDASTTSDTPPDAKNSSSSSSKCDTEAAVSDSQAADAHTSKSKVSMRSHLAGEVYWYTHAPSVVFDAHLVPSLVAADSSRWPTWLEMERVPAVPAALLLTYEALSPGLLTTIMKSLARLHGAGGNEAVARAGLVADAADMYANYSPKLRARAGAALQAYKAAHAAACESAESLGDTDTPAAFMGMWQEVDAVLTAYQATNAGVPVLLHGDPVLSNALITPAQACVWIDMRGSLGSVLSVWGDAAYDWAKVYQSLWGYEHVQLNVPITPDTYGRLARLRSTFWSVLPECVPPHAAARLRQWLPALTASLLLSLVSLHALPHRLAFVRMARNVWSEFQPQLLHKPHY